MTIATKALISTFTLGTLSSGGGLVYLFSGNIFPQKELKNIIQPSTTLDNEGLTNLEETIKKGENQLVYEYLRIDGEDKECIKAVQLKDKNKPENFKVDCKYWKLDGLPENKKVLWIKSSSDKTNSILGQWLIMGGEKDFSNSVSKETKKLLAKGDNIDLSFECTKDPMDNGEVEVKCLESQNNN